MQTLSNAPAPVGRAPNWRAPLFLPHLALATKLRWMIDGVIFTDSTMEVNGWFISPFHPITAARIAVNDTVVTPLVDHDPVLQTLFSELPPQTCYRFRFECAMPPRGFITLRYYCAGAPDGTVADSTLWSILHPDDESVMPGGGNIFRVIGTDNDFAYRIGGATVANRIDRYLRRTIGRSVADIGTVLDWGCGCGRVTRYLQQLGCRDLHGVDVDATNVNWCKANLPNIQFALSGLQPPLPFADKTFDLLIGISIFTHLREPVQDAWLAEIARVLKVGGLALITVMTQNQATLQGATPDFVARIGEDGFVVTDDNNQLHLGDTADNYYVNVYHSLKYIFGRWSRYFEIVEVVDFLGTHQDAVVLRRIR